MNSRITRLYTVFGLLATILAPAITTGCASLKKAAYEPDPRPATMQPIAHEARIAWAEMPRTDGSIYTDASPSWFIDDKAYRPGDILLVRVVQKNTGAKNADTDTARTSSISAKIKYLFGLEKDIYKKSGYPDNAGITDATGDWEPHNLIEANSANSFKGSGATQRSDTLEATVSTVVTEVMPNGNLVIYGHQTVTINNEASVLTVQGIVRPSDIAAGNIIDSQRIANADIQFTGSGVVSDKQHPGWGTRIFDWVWPF